MWYLGTYLTRQRCCCCGHAVVLATADPDNFRVKNPDMYVHNPDFGQFWASRGGLCQSLEILVRGRPFASVLGQKINLITIFRGFLA